MNAHAAQRSVLLALLALGHARLAAASALTPKGGATELRTGDYMRAPELVSSGAVAPVDAWWQCGNRSSNPHLGRSRYGLGQPLSQLRGQLHGGVAFYGSVFGGECANVSMFSDMPVEANADVLHEAPEGIMAGLTLEFLSARG